MDEQQINVRSPHGHIHFSRRYGSAPWKLRGQCPASDLTGLFESAMQVVKRLEESHEEVQASSEPPRPSQGEADAVAQGGNQASEEGRAPRESVEAELAALRAENERLKSSETTYCGERVQTALGDYFTRAMDEVLRSGNQSLCSGVVIAVNELRAENERLQAALDDRPVRPVQALILEHPGTAARFAKLEAVAEAAREYRGWQKNHGPPIRIGAAKILLDDAIKALDAKEGT